MPNKVTEPLKLFLLWPTAAYCLIDTIGAGEFGMLARVVRDVHVVCDFAH